MEKQDKTKDSNRGLYRNPSNLYKYIEMYSSHYNLLILHRKSFKLYLILLGLLNIAKPSSKQPACPQKIRLLHLNVYILT